MPDGVSIRVSGDDELGRDLRNLGDDLEAPEAMDDIARQAAQIAAQATPRKSGALASGWRPSDTPGRASIENAVPYAGPIDRGWPRRNIAPRNITERTDRALEPTAVRLLEADINREIRQRGLTR